MASSDGLWVAAAVAVALIAAQATGGFGSAEAQSVSSALSQQVGQQVTMNGMYVESVPADEGFWVDGDHGRMWVQIDTVRESPYDVDAGDTVSFTGRVVAHGPDFPGQVGVTSAEGAGDLAAAGAHITIPLNGLAFNNV